MKNATTEVKMHKTNEAEAVDTSTRGKRKAEMFRSILNMFFNTICYNYLGITLSTRKVIIFHKSNRGKLIIKLEENLAKSKSRSCGCHPT